jgi:hypothetical protein
MSRTRNKFLGYNLPGYSRTFYGPFDFGSTPSSIVAEKGHVVCIDDLSHPPYVTDQNLTLTRTEANPLRINGVVVNPPFTVHYVNWNPLNRSTYVYCPGTTDTPWTHLVTKAIATINPNVPLVDLPLFLFELREFPRMLRQLGEVLSRRLHPRDIPDGHLAYSFGWKPLIMDLLNLIDLQREMDRKLRRLRAAASKGGARLGFSLGSDSSRSSTGDYNLLPDGQGNYGFRSVERTTVSDEYWCSAKMMLDSELPPHSEVPDFLRRNLLGLNVSASTLWNAVPWTWLIDYFVNIGDVMDANRGGLRFRIPTMCIMHHSVATSTLEGAKSDLGLTWVAGSMKTDSKKRAAYVFPQPNFAFRPFLTNGMMAIMGSLLTSKALGGKSIAR